MVKEEVFLRFSCLLSKEIHNYILSYYQPKTVKTTRYLVEFIYVLFGCVSVVLDIEMSFKK